MNLDSVIGTFIAESQELLQQMEDALLQIEQTPDDAELINAIFRAAHTIKGSSGLFGFDSIVAFTHVAESVLDQAGLTTNKNLVPFDPRKAMVTSGIRIGTPAVTTRGMGEGEMSEIASFIVRSLENAGDEERIAEIRSEVEDLCRRFPLYPDRWSEQD